MEAGQPPLGAEGKTVTASAALPATRWVPLLPAGVGEPVEELVQRRWRLAGKSCCPLFKVVHLFRLPELEMGHEEVRVGSPQRRTIPKSGDRNSAGELNLFPV